MADVYEYAQTFLGGMNQGVDPMLLAENQYAFAVNVQSRGGLPKTRPSFSEYSISLPNGGFQGAAVYRLDDGDHLVFGLSGHVYSLNLSTALVTDYGLLLSSTVDRFFFRQADKYMIVQDGDPSTSWSNMSWPVILNGANIVDQGSIADRLRVPKGGPMVYLHGRLFVATPYVYVGGTGWTDNLGMTNILAGDIIKASDPSEILNFTETGYLNGGGAFKLPEELGYIYAMGVQRNINSGTGQGPMIVGAEHGFVAYQVNAPRSEWQNIDVGIILFSGEGVGTVSNLGMANYGSDLFYRSKDGLRSLKDTNTRTGEALALQNTPLSGEVRDLMKLDNKSTLKRSSLAVADQRIVFSAVPSGSVHKALISLDMTPVSAMNAQSSPIYDGVWTGLDVLQVLSARYDDQTRIFVFCDDDANLRLVYLDDDAQLDPGDTRPASRLYLGYKTFGNPFEKKQLRFIEIWCRGLYGDVDVTAYFRPDGYPLWSKMASGKLVSGTGSYRQVRGRLRLPANTGVVTALVQGSRDRLDIGYAFQVCLEWTGRMQVDKVMFTAEMKSTRNFIQLCNEPDSATDIETGTDIMELNDYENEVF